MGKTYKKNPSDDYSGGNSGKPKKHVSGKKTGGMRTINSYVEEDYDFDDDSFNDEIEIHDDIQIQHTKNTR
jgi:hypothetical protein